MEKGQVVSGNVRDTLTTDRLTVDTLTPRQHRDYEDSSDSSSSMTNSPSTSIPHIEVSSTDNIDIHQEQSPLVKTGDLFADGSFIAAATRRKSEGDIPRIQFLSIREENETGMYKCDFHLPSKAPHENVDNPSCPLSPWRKKRANSLTYDIGMPREFPVPMSLHMSDNKVIPAQRRRSFTAELQTLEPIKEDINVGANKL